MTISDFNQHLFTKPVELFEKDKQSLPIHEVFINVFTQMTELLSNKPLDSDNNRQLTIDGYKLNSKLQWKL